MEQPPLSFASMEAEQAASGLEEKLEHTTKTFVADANTLAARTCLLILLVLAMGGAWVIEQPAHSVLEYYPRFRVIWKMVKVFKAAWCMRHYGAATPNLNPKP